MNKIIETDEQEQEQELTVDSEQLNDTYSGFSECQIKFIKETFVLCQYIHFLDSSKDFSITIDGNMVNKPNYTFFITRLKLSLKLSVANIQESTLIQVFRKRVPLPLVGLYVWKKVTNKIIEKDYLAYHITTSKNWEYDDL